MLFLVQVVGYIKIKIIYFSGHSTSQVIEQSNHRASKTGTWQVPVYNMHVFFFFFLSKTLLYKKKTCVLPKLFLGYFGETV